MGDQYTVDSQAVRQAATRTENSANIIKGLESRLNGYKSSLLASWKGDAAQAFGAAFERFETDMVKVRDALEDMYEGLTRTGLSYESTEQEQVEAVNKINELINRGG